jgi:hypothetical protein
MSRLNKISKTRKYLREIQKTYHGKNLIRTKPVTGDNAIEKVAHLEIPTF